MAFKKAADSGITEFFSSLVRLQTWGEAAGLGYFSVAVAAGAFILWYDALGRTGADRAGLFAVSSQSERWPPR